MAKCVVIGGGLSGISASVFLSKNNHQVHLIEASPKLGGKAYSFIDNITSDEIDNGQHILTGAYKNTFELLRILGTENLPFYQDKLSVAYINREKKKFYLKAPHKIFPLNLLQAILNFNLLSFKEKTGIIKTVSKLLFVSEKKLTNKTVAKWIGENKQSDESIKKFWNLLTVSVLNTSLKEASAKIFVKVLKELFLHGNKAATIVLPQVGLSKLFCTPAESYLKEKGTKISLSEKVVSIKTGNERVTKIITDKREITEFDYVISAVPFYYLQKIFPQLPFLKNVTGKMETSPIITIHLWLNENILKEKFYGLIDSKIHWVYQNKNHISVVISAAEDLINLERQKIETICINELKKYFNDFKKVKIKNIKVLKEKRATFKSTPLSDEARIKIKSPYKNFILAGDWTNTNLPATIEGAVLSGKKVAEVL